MSLIFYLLLLHLLTVLILQEKKYSEKFQEAMIDCLFDSVAKQISSDFGFHWAWRVLR